MPLLDRHRASGSESSTSLSDAGSRPGGSLIDPRTLMRIKSLQIRARVAVEGFIKGIHRSPYHGFSVEFSEYREYSPGDDPRYLDWRLYARSDRYYVKRFEDETNLRCNLVVDTSRSMGYRSGPYSKSDYARTAAATIAYFLASQRDAVGLLLFEDRITDYLPPRYRPGHLRRLMAVLDREPEGRATNLVEPLEQIAATVRKRGLIILISDLLAPADSLQSAARVSAFARARRRRAAGSRPGRGELHVHDARDVSRRGIGQGAVHRPGGGSRGIPAQVCCSRRRRSSERASTWGLNTSRSRPTGRSSSSSSIFCGGGCAGFAARAAGLHRDEEATVELLDPALRPRAHGRDRLRSCST